MKYKTNAYLITCLTNLHVGSGDANYGVIDNLVQRDVVTGLPTIHSSSLKGALREFFKNQWSETDIKLKYIFGPDNTRDASAGENIGHYKFFAADILTLPIRSNKKPFYRATSKEIIEYIIKKAKAFEVALDISTVDAEERNPKIKDIIPPIVKLEDWLAVSEPTMPEINHVGNDVAFLNINNFKQLAKKTAGYSS
jgi:CRISPR-associated protein Cmr4